jgi:DNA-binding MarR family transcriptional regulator
VAALDMVVLGLGLGMVMQVLVLAVQNAVDYTFLGVATSGSTMFRQIGGSIGVSLFGAIFTNRLHTELAHRLPVSAHLPTTTSPATIRALPPAVHDPYVHALTAALSPVFFVAAVVSAVAFVLALLIPEIPLRHTSTAEGIGETFATPSHADSEQEFERVLSVIARRDERWRAYAEWVNRAGVDLDPMEAWLLARTAEHAPASVQRIAEATGVDAEAVRRTMERLEKKGLVADSHGNRELTPEGHRVCEALVAVRRATLEDLVRDWSPADHAQLTPLLDRLARSLASEMPTPA